MYREWGAIDKLRLDKFMMLVRKFVREVFSMLQSRGWYEASLNRSALCVKRMHQVSPLCNHDVCFGE